MVYSMTGYGRKEFEDKKYKLSIELKTVNHKYCNIHVRMPSILNPIEDKIKKYVKEKLKRGRIELNIYFKLIADDAKTIKPNYSMLDQYHKILTDIKKRYKIKCDVDLDMLLNFDEAIDYESSEIDEEEIFMIIKKNLSDVIDSVLNMRLNEGKSLVKDIKENLKILEDILNKLSNRTKEVIEKHRENMREKINDLLGDEFEINSERLEQELAIYADKTDINEEIIRIKSHIDQFYERLKVGGVIGRKLDFLAQELNREINTIGSKSPDVNITEDVVNMKSLLSKIREQVQNIE